MCLVVTVDQSRYVFIIAGLAVGQSCSRGCGVNEGFQLFLLLLVVVSVAVNF